MAKSGNITKARFDINTYAVYLLPLSGILYRSYQTPEKFLFMDVLTLPISLEVVQFFIILSAISIVLQVINWIKQYKNNELSLPYVGYVISHYAVFAVSYMLIENINHGWLAINIWHNAQYIAFVWLHNNNRFKEGIDPEEKVVSTISQNNKLGMYFAVCMLITFLIYGFLNNLTQIFQAHTLLHVSIILYMTVNFHHYIVDSVIWKRPKSK